MNGPIENRTTRRSRRALVGVLAAAVVQAAFGAAPKDAPKAAPKDSPEADAKDSGPADGERRLRLFTVNQRESLDVVYRRGGELVPEAVERIEHLLRDRRNNQRGPIDPKLLDLLHRLAESLDADEPFHVISAYRSPATNDRRAATPGSGVAQGSLHVKGQAIDIRVPGVPLEKLRDTATTLKAGGVGYYPKSNFVHVDVGRVRSWVQEQ